VPDWRVTPTATRRSRMLQNANTLRNIDIEPPSITRWAKTRAFFWRDMRFGFLSAAMTSSVVAAVERPLMAASRPSRFTCSA